jgi:hypothetical protein
VIVVWAVKNRAKLGFATFFRLLFLRTVAPSVRCCACLCARCYVLTNCFYLCKQVSAHKKEIKTRDVSIGEKEKRIYELKKKNQVCLHSHFAAEYKAATTVWR